MGQPSKRRSGNRRGKTVDTEGERNRLPRAVGYDRAALSRSAVVPLAGDGGERRGGAERGRPLSSEGEQWCQLRHSDLTLSDCLSSSGPDDTGE